MQGQVRVVDNTLFSVGFPSEPLEDLIIRNNYLIQIEDELLNKTNILFVEGEEDSGKTTLCGLLAKRNVEKTISIFFNQSNDIDYRIEFYCSNVVAQIKNMIGETDDVASQSDYVGVDKYLQYIFQLRRMQKGQKGTITIIIDGLENKLNEDSDFVRRLLDIVPFGEQIFKFVISGEKQAFVKVSPKLKREDSKAILLAGFTEQEMLKYLGIAKSYPSEIHDLFKITKGFPGRLKTLKRLMLNDGYSLENISKTTSYKNWVELDCESIDLNNSTIQGLLSVLSLTEQSFTTEELANLMTISNDDLELLLKQINIIEPHGKSVKFVSSEHKKYFGNVLRGNKKKVQDLLVNYYSSSDTIKSLLELPRLYAARNEWDKIIGVMDETYLQRILETTGELHTVNDRLELGVKACQKTDRHVEMLRYSIQGSILNELDNYLFWESEIKARISIHDFAGAISLAESAVLRVDRLRLLALIARRQKEFTKTVDEGLVSLIQELYEHTELSSVGEKIFDIVADLIYAIPNLAIEMIEKSSGSAPEKNINDWIVAKLSIAAIDSAQKEENSPDKTKKIEAIQSLNNPSVRKINQAISFLIGNYTSEKVIEEVKKLSDSTERLRLLRLWLSNNHSNLNKVEDVIDLSLDELIASSSNSTLTLDVLKDLSQQLPYVKNIDSKLKLFKRFSSIEKGLSDLGLTKNKYTYELNMFHAELALSRQGSIITINRIITEIEETKDTLIKLESFSEVYAKLKILRGEELEKKNKFVYSRILALSEELFKATANHLKVASDLLKTVAKKNPVLAIKISDQINTLNNREEAKLLIADSYLDNNLKYVDIELLKVIEGSLYYASSKQTLYNRVLERYAAAKSLHYDVIKDLFYFTDKIEAIPNLSQRAFGQVLTYKIIAKNDDWRKKLSQKIEDQIYKTWSAIEADWERIDTGFSICSDLAVITESFSKKLFNETEKVKKESWIDSSHISYTYFNSLALVIRAYSTLVSAGENVPKDYEVIENLISRIPSEIYKLTFWTEVGFNAHFSSEAKLVKKIIDTHVIPLIHSVVSKKLDLDKALDAFTLLHLSNAELALEYLKNVSEDDREDVFESICEFYVNKRSPFEVYERSPQINRHKASFNDLSKAVNVLSLINTDRVVYWQLQNICKAIKDNKEIASPQVIQLSEKMSEIVQKKLPDSKNIKHDGYKILATMKLSKLKKSASKDAWMNFIREANQITNESDRVLVKSILLEDMPHDKIENGNEIRAQLFEDTIKTLEALTVHFEFIDRVLDISDTMYKIDRVKWKVIVKKAFTMSSDLESGSDAYQTQKNLVETMHRLDPEFAKDLVKFVDSDNRENKVARLLNEHYEALEISKKIKNNKSLDEKELQNHRHIVKGIVQAIRSLNSEQISPKKISDLLIYLPIGNKLPLHEVIPVYIYYLANCARTYRQKGSKSNVADLHRDNFKEAVKATDLVGLLSQRKRTSERNSRTMFIDEMFTANKAVRPGSREEAINFIKSWLADEVEEFIIIADPYFQKEDLEILVLLKEACDDIQIDILGSINGRSPNIESDFADHWKKLSQELPPYTTLTFCWIPGHDNQTPFHDRWLITKNSGLRLGTSLNSLGLKKESELSIMKPNEALKIKETTLMEYVERKKRIVNNERVAYKSFTLN